MAWMESWLQWRAEQLPGQTVAEPRVVMGGHVASMEGRAIARPNQPRRYHRGRGLRASMEGRAIARPNVTRTQTGLAESTVLQWRAEQLPGQTRPRVGGIGSFSIGFNGGPSNCPAKRPHR